MLRVAIVVLIVAAAVLAVGCQNLIESAVGGAIEKTTGVSVSKDGNTVSVKDKDGNQITVGGGELAAELRDFPLPANYTLQRDAVGTISSKEGKLASGTWKGGQTVQQAVDYFKRELPGKGYKEDFVTQSTDGALLQFTNASLGRSVAVTVSKDGNGSLIAVLMTTKA